MRAIQFSKVCDAETLESAIIAAGLAKPARLAGLTTDPSGDVKAPRVVVYLADDCTDDEIAAVQKTVDAHVALDGDRAARLAALRFACRAYIFTQYDDGTQASLNALFTEAVASGYANRVAKIRLALDWIKGCLDHYYSVKDAIGKAADPAAVSWDFLQFDATIPEVSLRDVRALTS